MDSPPRLRTTDTNRSKRVPKTSRFTDSGRAHATSTGATDPGGEPWFPHSSRAAPVRQTVAEPAMRIVVQAFFGFVSLPAGEAGLRRRIDVGSSGFCSVGGGETHREKRLRERGGRFAFF